MINKIKMAMTMRLDINTFDKILHILSKACTFHHNNNNNKIKTKLMSELCIDILNNISSFCDYKTGKTLLDVCTIFRDNIKIFHVFIDQNTNIKKFIDNINIDTVLSITCKNNNRIICDMISRSYRLTYLDCGSMIHLNDIHFTHLRNLKTLICGLCGQITSDVFEYLPSLTYLDCGSNMKFDKLSNLSNLKTLICGSNFDMFRGESEHDIKQLSSLTYLDCGNNDRLSDRSIMNLTNLKTLIIGVNSKLSDKSITTLTNLTYLDCGYTNKNITNISIESLCKLETLICNSKITEECLKHVPKLTYLNCKRSDGFTCEGIKVLRSLKICI